MTNGEVAYLSMAIFFFVLFVFVIGVISQSQGKRPGR